MGDLPEQALTERLHKPVRLQVSEQTVRREARGNRAVGGQACSPTLPTSRNCLSTPTSMTSNAPPHTPPVRRAATDSSQRPAESLQPPITIARWLADAPALRRLAESDSAALPSAPVLIAEADGELRAAVSLDDGAAIAHPLHHTAGSSNCSTRAPLNYAARGRCDASSFPDSDTEAAMGVVVTKNRRLSGSGRSDR